MNQYKDQEQDQEQDETTNLEAEAVDLQGEPDLISDLDRVMRLLRRRPRGAGHGGRGTHRMLRLIAQQPGLSTRELADRMEIRPSSLNEKLSQLEASGWIRRHRDPRDQRVFLVDLESAGEDQIEAARAQRGSLNQTIREILSPEEIRDMSRLARRLAEGLDRLVESGTDGTQAPERSVADYGR